MRDMKRQWLTNLAYVLLGMLLLVAYEHGASIAALVIYKNDFVSNLIACQLAKKHANELANIELTSPLQRELHKTSLIDLMSCDSYQHTRSKLTFPRFHRHFHTWENEKIGGQDEHEDTTVVYGDVQGRSRAVSPGVRASRRPGGAGSGDCRSSPLPMASGAAAGRRAWTDPTIFTGRAGGTGPAAA